MSEQGQGADPGGKPEEPGDEEITVSRRARSRPDRAGDPLDGLVNLFDLGIVLAVAFLLAALSSFQLSDLLTKNDVSVVRQNGDKSQTVITKKGNQVKSVNLTQQKVVGQGTPVGTVYKLDDGRTVVVQDGGTGDESNVAPDATPPDTGSTPPVDPNSVLPPASGATPTTPTTPDDGVTSPFG